ncbi:MAG: glycosyltransferase family 4 protein [Proteobacteria bacterium]|nr:glycosyltransferase family 4 protein [Pseudomonadota bacterium]MDA0993523.1 glycosyltransferase family 4 protein [Pseudomonadota bacterium]
MTKPLTVLCVNGESDPAETGSFIEMHKRGVDITVITWPGTFNYDALIAAGVHTIPYVLKGKISRPCIRFIRDELKRKPYDILHMLDKRATMNGLWASRGMNVKLVAYRGIVGNLSYFDPQSWLYLLNPRIDRIICVCEAIRRNLLSLGVPGIRLRREVPVTIHKGHNPGWYQPPFENLKQFGIPDDAFVVACTARGVPRKGVPVLLDAIDKLPRGLNMHFLLAGTNMDSRLHQKLAAKNTYADNIHLHGFLKRMPWILPNCHIAVLPSLRREGLPRGIIEAMIGGAVPIVTNSGGSPELIEEGISGYIVPPGEAQPIADRMLQLYNDREQHGKMSKAAHDRIRNNFKVEDTAIKTIALYEEIIGPD